MKKLTFITMAVFALLFTACNSNTSDNIDKSEQSTGLVYTCPMDPEVISDKPGKCPKCKMELVLKNQVEEDHTGHNH